MASLRNEAATKVQSIIRMYFGKQRAFQEVVQRRLRNHAILNILKILDGKMYAERTRKAFAAVVAWRNLERHRRRDAAVMIQSVAREHIAGKQVMIVKAAHAGIIIQRYTRGYYARRLAKALRLERILKEQNMASIKIQSIARRNQAMALRRKILATKESERVAAERNKVYYYGPMCFSKARSRGRTAEAAQ